MSDEETNLINRAKKGEIEAFERLIENHQQKIFNFAYSLVGDVEIAKDVTQQALIKAYLSIKKFHGKSSFTTWLYRIINNVFQDELRKPYYKHETPTIPISSPSNSSNSSAPEEVLAIKEKQILVQQTIKSLPPDLATIIILKDIQGFSYEEIREIVNIPLGTVKSRLFRAREILKENLREIL